MSYVKLYHVYKALWNPAIGECWLCQQELHNPEEKHAISVKKENEIIGHLPFGRSGKFAKTTFYFLRADKLNSCKVIITGKPANLGDGYISEVKECIDITKTNKI